MKLLPARLLFGLLAGVLIAGAAGYQIHARAIAVAAPTHPTASPVKLAHNAKLGRILVTTRGLTLYYFKRDNAGHPTCIGSCAQNWPPLLTHSVHLGKFHLSGKLGTVPRPGGRRQVTYNGWPLYRFVGDRRPGNARGQGILGLWFAATRGLHHATKSAPLPTASPATAMTPLPTIAPTASTAPPTTAPTATPLPTTPPYMAPPPTATPYVAPAPTATPYTAYPPVANPTPVNCIPDHDGGDMDGDNNGAPSDDDGCQ